jgi:hypothetical protein
MRHTARPSLGPPEEPPTADTPRHNDALVEDLQSLFLAPELMLESFDFTLILGAEVLQLIQRLYWLMIGRLGCLAERTTCWVNRSATKQ